MQPAIVPGPLQRQQLIGQAAVAAWCVHYGIPNTVVNRWKQSMDKSDENEPDCNVNDGFPYWADGRNYTLLPRVCDQLGGR